MASPRPSLEEDKKFSPKVAISESSSSEDEDWRPISLHYIPERIPSDVLKKQNGLFISPAEFKEISQELKKSGQISRTLQGIPCQVVRRGHHIFVYPDSKEMALGKGNFAQVVPVYDCNTHTWYALKQISVTPNFPVDLCRNEITVLEAAEELPLPATDKDDSSCWTRDAKQSGQLITTANILMRLHKGQPLENFMRKNKLSIQQILTIMHNIFQAVARLSARGIIHRDLKPENFLIDPVTLEINIIDYGLSVKTSKSGEPHKDQRKCGTPAFVAPEIFWAAKFPNFFNSTVTYSDKTQTYEMGVTFVNLIKAQYGLRQTTAEQSKFTRFFKRHFSLSTELVSCKDDLNKERIVTGDLEPRHKREQDIYSGVMWGMLNWEPNTRPTLSQIENHIKAVGRAALYEAPMAAPESKHKDAVQEKPVILEFDGTKDPKYEFKDFKAMQECDKEVHLVLKKGTSLTAEQILSRSVWVKSLTERGVSVQFHVHQSEAHLTHYLHSQSQSRLKLFAGKSLKQSMMETIQAEHQRVSNLMDVAKAKNDETTASIYKNRAQKLDNYLIDFEQSHDISAISNALVILAAQMVHTTWMGWLFSYLGFVSDGASKLYALAETCRAAKDHYEEANGHQAAIFRTRLRA